MQLGIPIQTLTSFPFDHCPGTGYPIQSNLFAPFAML
jgi:hypothetical protein